MNIIDLTQANGGGSGEASWGNISGDLDDQTDLQEALSQKADDDSVVHIEGQETITGSKTFSANTYIGSVGEPADLGIVGDLNIQGDIIQNGSSYETHAEKIYTKNDYITLREGAESGLLSGDYSGFQVEKYDGTNDGRLVIDNTGTARVGDVGDEQPLLTRDESASLTDDGLLIWDSANSKAVNLSTITADDSGNLTATSFVGNLIGNATSATKATNDGADNNIVDTYANQSFSNINNNGYNVLANSNALKTGDALDNNTTIYNDIYDKYCSAFDVSNVTVAGTPTITTDGTASNFSSSNYIEYISTNFATADSWQFDIEFTTGSDITTSQVILGSYPVIFGLDLNISNGYLRFGASNSDSSFNIYNNTIAQLIENTSYLCSIRYNGSNYQIEVNGINVLNLESSVKVLSTITGISLGIIRSTNVTFDKTQFFKGSINLNKFKIYINNKLSYTFMTTGTDIVECDKYTTSNPAPIISDEGVLTGTDSRYILYTGIDFTQAQSFKICGSFNCSGNTGVNQYFIGGDGFTYGLYVSGTQAFINLSTNGTSFNIWQSGGLFNISYGQKYWWEFEFTGTQYKINYSTNGISYTTSLTFNSTDINPNLISSFVHYVGNAASTTRYFNGEIDLKDFKVYINNTLVYAPYLQIPYTRSVTGSKIVDNSYREYLTHLADVKGSALYYTIDEANKQYALPIGDIYGFISGSLGDVATLLSEV